MTDRNVDDEAFFCCDDSLYRKIDSGHRSRELGRERPIREHVQALMRAKRLHSSLIDRIVFDDDVETLTVWFKQRGKYIYHGVPRALYDAFGKASSAGRFFNEMVRGKFEGHPESTRRRYPLPDV